MIRKKILLLGDFNVGKTSLIKRYIDKSFDDVYLTTIGVKISTKICTINETEYEILIWDIEGATPAKEIPLLYYNGASGAIFVCDVNRSETCDSLANHIDIFLQKNAESSYVVAYNKVDLLNTEQRLAFDLGEEALFTSAKEDENVEELFTMLMHKMLT